MRKLIVEQIAREVKLNNYPCIGINYITSPGKNAGYWYMLWWNNIKLITPGNDVSVYSIVNPAGYSKEINYQEGGLD